MGKNSEQIATYGDLNDLYGEVIIGGGTSILTALCPVYGGIKQNYPLLEVAGLYDTYQLVLYEDLWKLYMTVDPTSLSFSSSGGSSTVTLDATSAWTSSVSSSSWISRSPSSGSGGNNQTVTITASSNSSSTSSRTGTVTFTDENGLTATVSLTQSGITIGSITLDETSITVLDAEICRGIGLTTGSNVNGLHFSPNCGWGDYGIYSIAMSSTITSSGILSCNENSHVTFTMTMGGKFSQGQSQTTLVITPCYNNVQGSSSVRLTIIAGS